MCLVKARPYRLQIFHLEGADRVRHMFALNDERGTAGRVFRVHINIMRKMVSIKGVVERRTVFGDHLGRGTGIRVRLCQIMDLL